MGGFKSPPPYGRVNMDVLSKNYHFHKQLTIKQGHNLIMNNITESNFNIDILLQHV